ncbi:V-type proton ATPase subunit S1-like isoform X2 [Eublepharis macularius]|uniref:V-type proton ATPase subunit S1-like isoform X2 n=1 Tax=Eublepharis macularius TaxID=481883 RepID=A0AA97JXS4_EUBMA|nr:V-type proton ATPase subunit S1-like isoform X2 [Eublepharis macularius]
MARGSRVSWVQLFGFFGVLCRGVFSVAHTPMLLWSSDRSLQGLASNLHEGGIISQQKLHKLLQHTIPADSRNLVVFLQDTLSVDDFTRYADSAGNETPFLNVQRLLKNSSSSLVLSAVDCQAVANLTEYLQKTLNLPLVNVDGTETSHLMVNASKPDLFVIKLQPTARKDEPSTLKALMENDKIIGRFSEALQQQGVPSLMIYTARQPSRVPVQFHGAGHSRRQLMSAEAQDNSLYAPVYALNGTQPCILFYATNFSLIVTKNKELIPLSNLTFGSPKVNTSSSWCLSSNAILSLQYTEPVSWIKSLEIRFVMTNRFYGGSARNWLTLDYVEIVQDNETAATFNVSMISSPVEYSFRCQLVGTSSQYGAMLIPGNDAAKSWEIVISDFQIQAFSVQNTTFSYASDCTSFFTPAIWMALVTSLVLLLILTYGIHMIVNLTTNNRFDDPKGSRLSVPETE